MTKTSPAAIALDVSLPFHRYGSIVALQNISVSFEKGSLTAIVGPNGGGKSTLIKLLSGLIKPQSGYITRAIDAPTDIAYLPQTHTLDRTFPLLASNVIAMGLWPHHKEKADIIPQVLAQAGLAGFEKRSLAALSGGQFQRLLFARLIAQNAPIILLDEPFSGIDQATMKDLLSLIHEWHQRGKTIVAVFHDLPLVREHFPVSFLLAQEGIAYGATADVLTLENLARAAFHA